MKEEKQAAISPTRNDDYPQWYLEVIKAADLAENSDVKGCIIFKPWGYAIWEEMQKGLDFLFKKTGHKNAYFPLFIPLSYLQKEADHVDGFAKECAVVTHHKLTQNSEGKLVPDGELEEPLIVRPTSETIIGASFARWVQSYRDLPILINQWANVVRWELRTRTFLRTTEFLWQEGHTAHATKEEAVEETFKMLDVYKYFLENILAIPVIQGEKTEGEKFPGAVATYSIEAMMQDKKALQAGTSHFLGQNFAKASEIKFQSKEGKEEYAWTTSWGVSTRLIGALIMVHADDNGMVIPPRVAPAHIALLPIYKTPEEKAAVLQQVEFINAELAKMRYHDAPLRVEIDDRDLRGGEKNWQWIKKGVPLKIEIGPKDLAKNSVAMLRRDACPLKPEFLDTAYFLSNVTTILDDMQNALYQKALKLKEDNIKKIDDKAEFYQFYTPANKDKPEIHGGFAQAHWCGSAACEEKIKEDLKVTIRNIPLDAVAEEGKCICCEQPSQRRVVFAKSY